ncbi:MAG: hypothetical protein E7582_05900 [Ruminococcaceae bacterium]|nr:hypothetical protein [Oscillospiraceae bacterium]
MKIKTKKVSFDYVLSLPAPKHKKPKKPWFIFRTLVRILSMPDLIATKFKYQKVRMEEAGEGPYLILMNHSSFIDLKIASKILYPLPYSIVCTFDTLVGKEWLMRRIGCIPTQKFVNDPTLIFDILKTIKNKKQSVLMYPEAGYTLDGTTTELPRKMGKFLKRLGVPVLMIFAEGAFLRDPLYNGLKLRKTKTHATLSCLFTKEEIESLSENELDKRLDEAFKYDHFKTQFEQKIKIDEPFRADGLERVLYKCPNCLKEDACHGNGTKITCSHCNKSYTMDEYGRLHADSGKTEFEHIPDWYRWQRECVRDEIEKGEYELKAEVEIGILKDYKALYMVGDGVLTHTKDGFVLDGCDGKLHYEQPRYHSYSLNSDYFWYEIGDVISIGDKNALYYCFPKNFIPVAKARLATEELYKT